MEEKNIKPKEEREVAMVECPFCNKAIEAPAKSDVIFACPHCHKELITYDKKTKSQKQPTENDNDSIKKKNALKWGGVAALICLFVYIIAYTPSMNATYIITTDYEAAIDIETEKALVRAAADGDNMKTLEVIGKQRTIHFNRGDRVKITSKIVKGLPDHYKVKRLSDGASALMPYKYLTKE